MQRDSHPTMVAFLGFFVLGIAAVSLAVAMRRANDLERSVDSYSQQVAALQREVTELRHANQVLTGEKARLAEQVAALRSRIADLTQAVQAQRTASQFWEATTRARATVETWLPFLASLSLAVATANVAFAIRWLFKGAVVPPFLSGWRKRLRLPN